MSISSSIIILIIQAIFLSFVHDKLWRKFSINNFIHSQFNSNNIQTRNDIYLSYLKSFLADVHKIVKKFVIYF